MKFNAKYSKNLEPHFYQNTKALDNQGLNKRSVALELSKRDAEIEHLEALLVNQSSLEAMSILLRWLNETETVKLKKANEEIIKLRNTINILNFPPKFCMQCVHEVRDHCTECEFAMFRSFKLQQALNQTEGHTS